jgi:hypothetical protein
MPTHDETARFWRDYDDLTPEERIRFRKAVREFIHDLKAGGTFRDGLGVKGVKRLPGVFEMTWAPDGRALFEYGKPKFPGDVNIIWLRCGTHDIFKKR